MATDENSISECVQHPDEPIQFFCGSHDQLCCNECIETDHNDCLNVKTIEDKIKEIDQSAEYIKFQQEVNDVKSISMEVNDHLMERENIVQDGLASEKDKLEQLRADINMLFDNIRTNIEEREQNASETDSANIQRLSLQTDHALNEIESIENKAENLKRANKAKELFIWMKKAKSKLPVLENQLDTLLKSANPTHLSEKAILPEVKGGTELNLIQIEEACIQFKLTLSKCVLANDEV